MKTLGWDSAWQAKVVELLGKAKVLQEDGIYGEVGLSIKAWPSLMGVKLSQERPTLTLRFTFWTKINTHLNLPMTK